MTKLGIFVGENNWTFFEEIHHDLAAHYETQVFKPRVYSTPILKNRLNSRAYERGIRAMLKNNDVCFFEWASDLLAVASHMTKASKIVARLHSFELFQWAPKINWSSVDKIICVSNAMQQMFCEIYPDQASKTLVIYNGRSLEHFYPPETRLMPVKFGMLGSIFPIKRVYEAVLMFNDILQAGYDARLHIAGDPAEDHRYFVAVRRLVDVLKLQDYVIFDGFQKDPGDWLKKIDVYISNSYWEGQQVALLEAMATGCYCLSHYWAGADEMLPRDQLFITTQEFHEKALAYFRMSDQEKLQNQVSMRSLAVEKFDVAKTINNIRCVIDELS